MNLHQISKQVAIRLKKKIFITFLDLFSLVCRKQQLFHQLFNLSMLLILLILLKLEFRIGGNTNQKYFLSRAFVKLFICECH